MNIMLFPAFLLGVNGFKAIQSVLPSNAQCYAVGGIGGTDFAEWCDAGIDGFSLVSNLYKPGDSPEIVASKATILVTAWDDTL